MHARGAPSRGIPIRCVLFAAIACVIVTIILLARPHGVDDFDLAVEGPPPVAMSDRRQPECVRSTPQLPQQQPRWPSGWTPPDFFREGDGVLLLIHYNSPQYQFVPLWRSVSRPWFARVIFTGALHVDEPDFFYCDDAWGGYGSYECFARVMRLFPGYRGYMYHQMDSFMNYHNLLRLDRGKVWYPVTKSIAGAGKEVFKGWWWGASIAVPALRQALVEVAETHPLMIAQYMENTDWWPEGRNPPDWHMLREGFPWNGQPDWKKYLLDTTPVHVEYSPGGADNIYVPREFIEQWQALSAIFWKHRVFLEIAVPMMVNMMVRTRPLGELERPDGTIAKWKAGRSQVQAENLLGWHRSRGGPKRTGWEDCWTMDCDWFHSIWMDDEWVPDFFFEVLTNPPGAINHKKWKKGVCEEWDQRRSSPGGLPAQVIHYDYDKLRQSSLDSYESKFKSWSGKYYKS